MKKVLAIVLSVAMLACFAIPAFAAGDVTITVGEYTAKAGDPVEVIVNLEGQISAANFVITYDTEVLTFDKMKKTGFTSDADAAAANEVEPGTIKIGTAASAPSDGDGVLVQLNFVVKEGVADNTVAEIKMSAENITVADGTDNIDILDQTTFVDGKVTVGEVVIPSDVESIESTDSTASTDSVASTDSTDSTVTPSETTPSTTAPSTTTPSTNNPKTGDAGVAVFAAIVAAAAAAAFVAGKKKA